MTRKRRSKSPSPSPTGKALPAQTVTAPKPAVPAPAPWRPGAAPWLALSLVPVVWAAFEPSLKNSFVGWDDPPNFLENQDYRGLGWTQIRWAWTTRLLGVYQPLAWMLLELQYAIGHLDPRVYHLTSLLLFCLDALVLDALVIALLHRWRPENSARDPWRLHASVVLAVALFVAHPLRVEVVAWASCQPYLPCALFMMLAVLAYLRAHPPAPEGPSRWGWALAALGLHTAALLCKAVAIPLPLVLLILDVYPLRRIAFRRSRGFAASFGSCLLEKVPYLALSGLFALIAYQSKQASQSLAAPLLSELPVRLSQASYGAWFYPARTLWPVEITAYYPLPTAAQWNDTRFVFARLLLVVVLVLLFGLRRSLPGLLAAWLSYLVILAPNSGLVRVGNQLAADRYSYIAMLGLVPLLAVGLAALLRPTLWPRQPVVVLGLVLALLGFEIGLTRRQCAVWHDSVTMWTHAHDHGADRDSTVLNNLGYALTLDGRAAEAIPYLTRSLATNPGDANAHHSLGTALAATGRDSEAVSEFEEALRLAPGHLESRRDLDGLKRRMTQGQTAPGAGH